MHGERGINQGCEASVEEIFLLRFFYRFVDGVTWVTKVILAVLMAVIIVNISADIFFRYVLVDPLNWSSQLAKYLMVWFAFLGSSLAFRESAHINTDILLRQMSRRWCRYFSLVSCLGIMIFLIVVFTLGFSFAYGLRNDVDPLLGLKMIYPFLAIPIGSIFMFVQVAWLMMEIVRDRRES